MTRIALFIFFAYAFSGCKVNYSFTGADIPPEAQTISVQNFQVRAPNARVGYGQELSESFKDLILQQTSLDLIEREGDLQFDGVVTGYRISNAGVSSDEITTVSRLTINVKVSYINTFDTEKNFERSFSRFADFEANQNLADVETQLLEEINDQLTQDFIDAAFGNW